MIPDRLLNLIPSYLPESQLQGGRPGLEKWAHLIIGCHKKVGRRNNIRVLKKRRRSDARKLFYEKKMIAFLVPFWHVTLINHLAITRAEFAILMPVSHSFYFIP